jgi:RimJ/RimL family protein N-acetyltransferase
LVVTAVLHLASTALEDDQRKLEVHYPKTRSRALVEADAEFLLELLSDPTIAWYEPMTLPASDAGARDLVVSYICKANDPSSMILGWSLIENHVKVGVCQLRREDGRFLVGVSLFPWARSRGLGTAVFSALAELAYDRLHATHVAGEVEDENIASIKALEKAGYVPTDRYGRTLDNGRRTLVTRYDASRTSITLSA